MPAPASTSWVVRWFDDFQRDAAYAVRSLTRTRGFTVAAVLTLSVGIGAATAIYSVVDSVLLQPLPYDDSDRLVRIVENIPSVFPGRPPAQRGVSYQNFLDWRTRTRTLTDAVAIVGLGQRLVRTADGTARLWGVMTSASTFRVLRAHAAFGRTLVDDDDTTGDTIVLSYDVWRRLFHGDPALVGTRLELRAPEQPGRVLTVVGVMPETFELPTGKADFFTPVVLDDATKRTASVTMIARLAPGIPLAAAIDEANVIGADLRPPRAGTAPLNTRRFEVQGLKDRMVQDLRPALRVLIGAVGVVLLIVCANVANLLLTRGTARQRELAVRVAIGAGRGRLVRQILSECVVLAAAGGVLGAALGAAGVALVKRLATVDAPGIFRLGFGATILPRANEVGVDMKVFGIAFATSAVACVVFGLLPALQISRVNHLPALGGRGSADRHGSRTRATLVVAQLMLATTLLVAAGLLMKSFITLSRIDTGYDPANVVAVQLVLPADYSINRKVEFIDRLLARLRSAPSVVEAGFTRAGVLIGEELNIGVFVPAGRTVDDMRPIRPRVRAASAGFLTAMGIRVLAGREFSAADSATAPPVIVMNRSAARQFFGATANPVGQVLEWNMAKERIPVELVGIVEEVRNETLAHEPVPEIFVEYRQMLTLAERWGDPVRRRDEMAIGFLSFAIRTRTDPASAIPEIGRIVRGVDANAGIDAIAPLAHLMASSVARPRFYAILLGVFAAVAALLAAIGVYGVLAYAVIQRTQEIGIRMALGAQRAQVLALVLRRGVALTIFGIALGMAGAAGTAPLLQSLLFGITPLDVRTFAIVAVLFAAVAIAASYVPARRAMRVDPVIALRAE